MKPGTLSSCKRNRLKTILSLLFKFDKFFPLSICFPDDEKMDSIHRAVDAFNRFTCVRFVKLDDNSDDLDRVKFKINGTM